MKYDIHLIKNKLGYKCPQSNEEASKVLADSRAGDIIQIIYNGKCIDYLVVIDGDINNQCDICAESSRNDHHCLCPFVPCSRGKGCNPRIPVHISHILEDL